MQRIAVIDYGMGNLRSVWKALAHVCDSEVEVLVTSDISIIANSDRVVCPGQGAAQDCMRQLEQSGMDKAVIACIAQGTPFLGICMGLQVLMSESAENSGIKCLDIMPGSAEEFSRQMVDSISNQKLKIPHMGWNCVSQTLTHSLWEGIDNHARFYFCHSFYVNPMDKNQIAGECTYGKKFTAVLAQDNIFACQFHPEKSAKNGLKLLSNFARWKVKV